MIFKIIISSKKKVNKTIKTKKDQNVAVSKGNRAMNWSLITTR